MPRIQLRRYIKLTALTNTPIKGFSTLATKNPAIIVISSHVVRGTVGNRAAAFALEVLGFPVWIVPTITLPWHPGHNATAGLGSRQVPSLDGFEALLNDLSSAPWLEEVGAVLSGYLGEAGQVDAVASLVTAVKQKNPSAIYALDPVLGDGDRLYVSADQADAIGTMLLPKADLLTPNPFELAYLTGNTSLKTNDRLLDAAKQTGVDTVVATSAFAMMKGMIGNLLWHQNKAHLAEHRLLNGPPNGLGDLTAALMLGNIMRGARPLDALQKTSASVYEVMAHSARVGSDELALEANLGSLLRPQTSVETRVLMTSSK